jgi:hypothetical protein
MANLQRFFGGPPVAVLVKLVLLSLLVGAFMAFVGVTPAGLFEAARGVLRSLTALGFDAVAEVGRWILYGAVVVVPIWLVARLLAGRRG